MFKNATNTDLTGTGEAKANRSAPPKAQQRKTAQQRIPESELRKIPQNNRESRKKTRGGNRVRHPSADCPVNLQQRCLRVKSK